MYMGVGGDVHVCGWVCTCAARMVHMCSKNYHRELSHVVHLPIWCRFAALCVALLGVPSADPSGTQWPVRMTHVCTIWVYDVHVHGGVGKKRGWNGMYTYEACKNTHLVALSFGHFSLNLLDSVKQRVELRMRG